MSTPENYTIDTLSYDLRRLANTISDIYLLLDDDSVDEGKRLPVARYAVRQAQMDLDGVYWKMCHLMGDAVGGATWADELAADPDGRCHSHAMPETTDANVDEVDARREAGNDVDR